MYARDVPPGTAYYHGTKANLVVGHRLGPGLGSNFVERSLKHVTFSATLGAVTWGAELARGEGRERITIVEPTGEYEERSAEPCRGHGEHCSPGHPPEQLAAMRVRLAGMKAKGTDKIID